jgi:RNA polymerase sigma factor (sigma-70 family)
MSKEAFIKLYDRYARPLYRHILFYSGNPNTAEDVVSASFLKLWEFIREGKRIRNFRALLYRTAKNTFLDMVRRKESTNLSLEELYEKKGWEPSREYLQEYAEKQDACPLMKDGLPHGETLLYLGSARQKSYRPRSAYGI